MRPYAVSETLKAFSGFVGTLTLRSRSFKSRAQRPLRKVDLLTDAFTGFGVLAGGTDDFVVKTASHTMTVMRSLVYKNVAGAVAGDVITRAQRTPSARDPWVHGRAHSHRAIQPKIMGLIGRLYSQYVEEGHPDTERLSRLFSMDLS